ncbi:hypothetical protein AJ79_07319 [Helicocarpus griseus UAMH5409]|uniref:Uncharacterized protein n=1 Tax=Helicocarpus griseus UAMH5409 TaxID=1447875 RepID=A0A2B7X4E4_9EURO|nr:hypothetical protein AJ79_07319 [Helicocarpus griseus UAMH5409]
MTAKISRRLVKLSSHIGQAPWLPYIKEQLCSANELLSTKWAAIQDDSTPQKVWEDWLSSPPDLLGDTKLTLSNLYPYFQSVRSRTVFPTDNRKITVRSVPRIRFTQDGLPVLPPISEVEENERLCLADLELWTRRLLLNGSEIRQKRFHTAQKTYSGCPVDMSRMILTLLGLWIALDIAAVAQCSLLKDYDPGFPPSLFEPLLLSKENDIEELNRIEQYLKDRLEKYKEFDKMKEEYDNLDAQWKSMSCDFNPFQRKSGEMGKKHSRSCGKCSIKKKAMATKIQPHEWPLPEDPIADKCVVFHLDVPEAVRTWLDTTYSILIDVLSPEAQDIVQAKHMWPLNDYQGLSKFRKSTTKRLPLVSTFKPVSCTEYFLDVELNHCPNASKACAPNGTHYFVFDVDNKVKSHYLLGKCDIQYLCTFQLPEGPYRQLQYAVDSTNDSTKVAIANQASCTTSLTYDEMYAFCSLRSGHRLQWRNIFRELISRTMNFNHWETNILLQAAIWQIGPYKAGAMLSCESHADLQEERFGLDLISALGKAVGRMGGNWQEVLSMRTFVTIATRILTSNPHENVKNECLQTLRRARNITEGWLDELNLKLQDVLEGDTVGLNSVALEVALTCHSTFDVDDNHLETLLQDTSDIATITKCCITLHERCPPIQLLPESTTFLVRRYWSLCHRIEDCLTAKILTCQGGLIGTWWPGYERAGSFRLQEVDEPWLVTEISRGANAPSSTVHYNVLNGELLIDGLTKLPRDYEEQDLCRRLFSGIHFAMHEGSLVVRADDETGKYEILPSTTVNGDFPKSFVTQYCHWLNLETNYIEFRPISDLWRSKPSNCAIENIQYGRTLVSGVWKLIATNSSSGQAVASILSPLELPYNMHVMINSESEELRVYLPRLKLDFFKNPESMYLESKQFRGMVVDDGQSFGTLTGLVNKLVLRGIHDSSRGVIIPYGSVSFKRENNHVRVSIDNSSMATVPYYYYKIDSELGRLVDNGSLRSKLFQCYIHASTSSCLADDLTRRTEGALQILWAASALSLVVEKHNIELLTRIAQLTPRRKFYPPNLKVMQEVRWNGLPFLSQHNYFATLAETLFESYRTFSMLQGDSPPSCSDVFTERTIQHLTDRDTIRDSTFRVDGFGAESFTKAQDSIHKARDHPFMSKGLERVPRTAQLVDGWSTGLRTHKEIFKSSKKYKKIGGLPALPENGLRLTYDMKWLASPTTFLPQTFLQIIHQLSRSIREKDKYRILFFLCTVSYYEGEETSHQLVAEELAETLLAFATVPELRIIKLPTHTSYDLSRGLEPNKKMLISITENCVYDFDASPESKLGPLPNESQYAMRQRLTQLYKEEKEKRVAEFVEALTTQWPTSHVSTPTNLGCCKFINVDKVLQLVQPLFESWHGDLEFKKFIDKAQAVLESLKPNYYAVPKLLMQRPQINHQTKPCYLSFESAFSTPAPTIGKLKKQFPFASWAQKERGGTTDYR